MITASGLGAGRGLPFKGLEGIVRCVNLGVAATELVRGLKAHGTTRDFIYSPPFDSDFFTRSTTGICNGPQSGLTEANIK